MEKEFKKEFKSCPVCKSKNKFCAELGKEIKKRGLTTKGWAFCYESRSGITMDKAAPVPLVGTTLPGFIIIVDICMDCGCVYASKIERLEGMIKPEPITPAGALPINMQFGNNPRLS